MNTDSTGKLGLSKTTLDKLNSVFRRYAAIDKVLVYGSRAKGNYRRGSDIDLTIEGSVLTFAELMQIKDSIDELYLPYCVDLSQYAQLSNTGLIAHIDRWGVVIYEKDAEAAHAH
jgi:predicted nucleotidyltransferase